MKMINRLKSYLQVKMPSRRSRIPRDLTTEGLCRRYARGNVNIQMGNVMTAARYEEQKKKVLSHEF